MENYIITNQNHTVVGVDRGDTVAFLGVPYANAKRFGKPVLHNLGKETIAVAYGNCCPQSRQFFDESKSKKKMDLFYYREFREGVRFKYGEDCLNLNIYAPKGKTNLPVLLYIHGGAFVICSSDEKPFDGQYIAREDVICVCANYRLNVFGYYADEKTSNLAFYDMICAIEWVKNNIAQFGGNPDNITLMGQSAGAISLQNLILLPQVKEMVKGAIMLSGGASVTGIFAPKSKNRAMRFFSRVRKDLQKRGQDILTADYRDVFLAWNRQTNKNLALSMLSTMPVFDGEIVRKDLYKNAFKDKQIPCIISVTKNDLLKPYLENCAQKWRKNADGKTWLTHFYHDLPGDDMGAYHSCDLWYIFGLEQHGWRKFSDADYAIASELRKRYCAFVRNQDPNCAEYPEWKEGSVLTIK